MAAQLACHAAGGELVQGKRSNWWGQVTAGMEKRALALKGKSEPVAVWVMALGQWELAHRG
jgi:hypothetical protein